MKPKFIYTLTMAAAMVITAASTASANKGFHSCTFTESDALPTGVSGTLKIEGTLTLFGICDITYHDGDKGVKCTGNDTMTVKPSFSSRSYPFSNNMSLAMAVSTAKLDVRQKAATFLNGTSPNYYEPLTSSTPNYPAYDIGVWDNTNLLKFCTGAKFK